MKKRILSVLLTACLALTLLPAASAKVSDVPQAEKAAVLRELEVMVGDETGALHLEREVTRGEFTKLLVCASPYKNAVGDAAGTDPYPDVSHTSWYAPFVRAAVDGGLVKGDLEGYFRPGRTITLAEGATMAVRLLGYQDGDFTAPWPAGQMALYRSLDLDAGLDGRGQNDPLTRQDCLHLFYNLLCAKSKQGTDYITLLGHTLDQDGEVDVPALFRVEQEGPIPLTGEWKSLLPFDVNAALVYRDGDRATLADLKEWDLLYWADDQAILFAQSDGQTAMGQVSAAVEGPVLAEGSWQSKLPFAPAQADSITRNGARAESGDLRPGDVVYWSKYGKNLYVYAKTVTGAVESVSPSLAAPTAVTVAGQAYPLETFEAQYAFSDLGSFRKGDMVTLHLGRTGGVAAVRAFTAGQTEARVGLVTALGSRTYTDAADKSYAAKTVTLLSTDGQSYTYPWSDDNVEVGDLASAGWKNGQAVVSRLSGRAVSGTFDAKRSTLGTLKISSDVEILDTYGDQTAKVVYPTRLDGVSLSASMVRHCVTDEAGTVTALILNDVTGDLHRYGVLTEAKTVSVDIPGAPSVLQGVYTYDLAGTQQTLPVSGKQFPVKEGPFCLKLDGQEVKLLTSLTRLADVTLTDSAATHGSTRHTLSDSVCYYLYDHLDDTYTAATRDQVLSSGHSLTAWYDAPDAQGGRVRVVVAQG